MDNRQCSNLLQRFAFQFHYAKPLFFHRQRLGENDRAVSKSDRLEIGAYRKKERENSPMLKPLHAVTNPSGESKQSTFNLFPSRRAEKANTAPAWEKKPLGKADNGSNNESGENFISKFLFSSAVKVEILKHPHCVISASSSAGTCSFGLKKSRLGRWKARYDGISSTA